MFRKYSEVVNSKPGIPLVLVGLDLLGRGAKGPCIATASGDSRLKADSDVGHGPLLGRKQPFLKERGARDHQPGRRLHWQRGLPPPRGSTAAHQKPTRATVRELRNLEKSTKASSDPSTSPTTLTSLVETTTSPALAREAWRFANSGVRFALLDSSGVYNPYVFGQDS